MSSPRNYRGKPVDGTGWVKGFRAAPDQIMIWDEERGVGSMIQVIPESVGQETGRKDKDGVEIYEGDMVRQLVTSTPKDIYRDKVVVYDQCSMKLEEKDGWSSFLEWPATVCLEVIGNITDKPELLKEQG